MPIQDLSAVMIEFVYQLSIYQLPVMLINSIEILNKSLYHFSHCTAFVIMDIVTAIKNFELCTRFP